MNLFPGKTVVGVTGGIACGKSTVCERFRKFGWEVISTDSLVHYFLDQNHQVKNKIFSHLGPEIKDEKGNIDKDELARVIFDNPSERTWIEKLLHPKVREKWISTIKLSSKEKFVVEIPLLFENNLDELFTNTISVFASSGIQNKRLQKRGLSDSEINSRIRAQMPLKEKSERADFVILADSISEFLDPQIKIFLSHL